MSRLGSKLGTMITLLRAGHRAEVGRRLRGWLHSDSLSYGFRRDLARPFQAPPARIPITVRRIEKGEGLELLNVRGRDLTGEGTYQRMSRRQFLESGIPLGYVAVTSDNRPLFVQFLVLPAQNARTQAYFGGLFPWLAPDEALVELAFTLEAYRGLGIMPSAMAQIAEIARESGARWAVRFVASYNIPSLKAGERAGFSPYLLRTERWRLFRRQVSFQELPDARSWPWQGQEESRNSTIQDVGDHRDESRR